MPWKTIVPSLETQCGIRTSIVQIFVSANEPNSTELLGMMGKLFLTKSATATDSKIFIVSMKKPLIYTYFTCVSSGNIWKK